MICEKCGCKMAEELGGYFCTNCLRVVFKQSNALVTQNNPYEPTWKEIEAGLYVKLSPQLQEIADLATELTKFYNW